MSNSNDSEINNNLEPEKNQENDPKLSRRDALKRAAKQTDQSEKLGGIN